MNVIVVAKMFRDISGGPSAVVNELLKAFSGMDVNVIPMLLYDDESKLAYVKKLLKCLVTTDRAAVNVHSDGYLLSLLVLFLSKVIRRHEYFLTIHGFRKKEVEYLKKTDKKGVFIEKILVKHFDNLIAVSQLLANDIKTSFGIDRKIDVIGNGTEAHSEAIYNRSDELKFISVGGLRFRKGIEEELLLYRFLNSKGLKISAKLYGTEEGNTDWFAQKCKEYNLDNVEYGGVIYDKQELYERIATADFQISFSKYDTFNVAIIESLVLGCPIITTDRSGASYLVDSGETGLVVGADELNQAGFEKIYEYIRRFDEDESCSQDINSSRVVERRQRIIEKAKARQGEFSWKQVAAEYLDLYGRYLEV